MRILHTMLRVPSQAVQDRKLDDLPVNAQNYVKAVEEMSGAPISAIGVGPGRDEIIQLRPLV